MKQEIENRFEVFFDIREMDLESLNQSQEEGGRLEGDAEQSFVVIDAARIQELTLIMKYFCNVKKNYSSHVKLSRLQCMD